MPTPPPALPAPARRRSPPVPAEVAAHRDVRRRLGAALVARDPAAGRDPRRAGRATVVGVVLGVLALAVAGVVGVVRGDTDWRIHAVVRGVPSGALYTVLHGPDRLVPTLDLASARLLAAAAGTPGAVPVAVRDDALADAPRTASAGIPGAPAVLPPPGRPDAAAGAWAVCDAVRLDPTAADPVARPARRTVVLAGVTGGDRPLATPDALLVRGDDGGIWLVAGGRRARLDPAEGAVVRALDLAGARPRVASPGFLDALPEAPPVVGVRVPGAGGAPADPATRALGARVGAVVTVPGTGAPLVLVLRDGVQEVPAVVAQLARFADPDPTAAPGIAVVAPAAVAAAPHVAGVDLRAFPAAIPRPVGYDPAPVVCARPDPGGGPATVTAAAVLPVPVPPTPLPDPGPGAPAAPNGVVVAGAGAYVLPAGPGGSPDPARGVLVAPGGRVHAVGPAAAAALGLGRPGVVPAAVVDHLPRGPALDLDGARALH